jgi:predicted permease
MNHWLDLRFTFRLLSKNLGFSTIAVLVIALGLGISLTLFNLVNNFRGKSLPYKDGERYVAVLKVDRSDTERIDGVRFADGISSHVLGLIRDQAQSYEFIGAAQLTYPVTMSDGESPEIFSAALVTPQLMNLTGVKPLLGRQLVMDDSLPEAQAVVLLGYEVWQNYYAGDLNVVGRYSRINGELYIIVGVMPEEFTFPVSHQLWLPMPNQIANIEGSIELTPLAVLKEGVSPVQANAELEILLSHIEIEYPGEYSDLEAVVMPFTRVIEPNEVPIFPVMNALGIVIFFLVLLNIGNLLLVRAGERTQELAIRSALGGTRLRVAQQLLVESFIICIGGGFFGLLFAHYGISFVGDALSIIDVPFWMSYSVGSDTVLWGVGITFMIWLLAGGITAWRTIRLDFNLALSDAGVGVGGKGGSRLTSMLVSLELILSVLLLTVSGTLVATLSTLQRTDYGTATDGYLTARVNLSGSRYQDPLARSQFYENLQRELNADTGVKESALTSALPGMQAPIQVAYGLEDRNIKQGKNYPTQSLISVTDNYFRTMEVDLVEGRHFNGGDTANSLPIVIVDSQFSQKMWPNQSPLGKRIQLDPESQIPSKWLTIVGVVPHIIQSPAFFGKRKLTSLYRPLTQSVPKGIQLAVNVEDDTDNHFRSIKLAGSRVDRDVPLTDIQSLQDLQKLSASPLKLLSSVFISVSLVTLVLATTGIYGMVSRSVLARTREVGIRRALGLSDRETTTFFLRQSLFHLLIGIIVGGGVGLMICYRVAALYVEVLSLIFPIFLGVSSLVGLLVVFASWYPARKIASMEPGQALHYQ